MRPRERRDVGAYSRPWRDRGLAGRLSPGEERRASAPAHWADRADGADAAAAVLARGARQPGRVRGSRGARTGLYDAVGLTRPGRFGAERGPAHGSSSYHTREWCRRSLPLYRREPILPQRSDREPGQMDAVPDMSDSHAGGSLQGALYHIYMTCT